MGNSDFLYLAKQVAVELEEANITYQFIRESALQLQGIEFDTLDRVRVLVQWDQFETLYDMYQPYNPTPISKESDQAEFVINRNGFTIVFKCLFNIAIKTDPYRIQIEELWCQSLYTYLFDMDNEFSEIVHQHLLRKQQEITVHNESAWNQNNYVALINRYGEPAKAAAKVRQNPKWRLHPFYKYLGDVQDKKIVHLLGSNGIKGTALALLGANVTVIDFSKENQRFAEEVAKEAGVEISYIVSDVLSVFDKDVQPNNDVLLMELGVLHYFIDLTPLAKVIAKLLKKDGLFILHEFHPISTKLITSTGKKHKVTGNYFDPSIHTKEVAFTKHMTSDEQSDLSKVLQRYWTLGEIITAFAKEGLFVQTLEEEPNHKLHDIGLPKTFTLCARKI
ncbi:class I SAM-dependent methyltransferase [Fredinandcohnia sp. 179-A 10B2 NHS]|uniref:class I SAM-dependent methyltransferase n=1 Tax=Fredinandcohnia sp. 179-A 10B2 NHS TaxID=3235176 RepID=UPI0039A21A14